MGDLNPILAGGQIEPGNIDLHNRPIVNNPDGTISTVRSIDVGLANGKAALGLPPASSRVLLPTVSEDGRIMSDQEAVDQFNSKGRHLGIFDTPDNASAYAKGLHNEQDKEYSPKSYPSLWAPATVPQWNPSDQLVGGGGAGLNDPNSMAPLVRALSGQ